MRYFLLCTLAGLLLACRPNPPVEYIRLQGKTMGTTYSISYLDKGNRNFQESVDSLLEALNLEVSTYIPQSSISAFNQAQDHFDLSYDPGQLGRDYPNIHFLTNFKRGLEIAKLTGEYFNPTVMPLVNYWGFGYTAKRPVTRVDSIKIDSLMEFVGLEKIQLEGQSLVKTVPGVQLDFSAIAKGYGVDLVGSFLLSKGIDNYFIEIGGEVVARGKSPRGDSWKIGINVPLEEAPVGELAATAPLEDEAVATSGNYRNYYQVEGQKYGHTINPFTGFPEKSNLLSASVFAKDCTTADALATAFMVMGVEKAKELVEKIPDVEAYFIVGTETGGMTTISSSGLVDVFAR